MGHNPLTTTGIATLSDALLTNDTITSLDLECTGMRDAGIRNTHATHMQHTCNILATHAAYHVTIPNGASAIGSAIGASLTLFDALLSYNNMARS